MRLSHFEAFAPSCPVCGPGHALRISKVELGDEKVVEAGVLECPVEACRREYPIIDGVPIIVGPIREFFHSQVLGVLRRPELPGVLESLVGDACGPGSLLDAERQMLSTYGHAHWGDLAGDADDPAAGATGRLARDVLEAAPAPAGLRLDVGCALGRGTAALAEDTDELVLGIDLSFAMLRRASIHNRGGALRYPLRRYGLVYDERVLDGGELSERVDFWACDATVLPLQAGRIGLIQSLNLLDCVPSPAAHFEAATRLLAPGGVLALTTPWDWSPGATPVEAWLGGHSQRSPSEGSCQASLRRLASASTRPLESVADREGLRWPIRVHAHHRAEYAVSLQAWRALD